MTTPRDGGAALALVTEERNELLAMLELLLSEIAMDGEERTRWRTDHCVEHARALVAMLAARAEVQK